MNDHQPGPAAQPDPYSHYTPPFTLRPAMLGQVATIGELLGRYNAHAEHTQSPQLRRGNRIRTIQSSLAIEANSLSLEQVTGVVEGKHVLGHPREITEVRNALRAYESLDRWQPDQASDLLQAHGELMQGLVDQAGAFRGRGVGIVDTQGRVLHMAPPPARVPQLVTDLLTWLATTDVHPLVSSCVVHYELEFIHPFVDGNGRIGRLWQTLILMRWQPALAYLPVETVVRERQEQYYAALRQSDQEANASAFIEFMLAAIQTALEQALETMPER